MAHYDDQREKVYEGERQPEFTEANLVKRVVELKQSVISKKIRDHMLLEYTSGILTDYRIVTRTGTTSEVIHYRGMPIFKVWVEGLEVKVETFQEVDKVFTMSDAELDKKLERQDRINGLRFSEKKLVERARKNTMNL